VPSNDQSAWGLLEKMKKVPQSSAKRRPSNATRKKFPIVSEEMKQWSAMLQAELNSWPAVTSKSMFGFLFFYRRGSVFAGIPRTRGLESPSALLFKFPSMSPALRKRAESDARMGASLKASSKGWFTFELGSDNDLRDALFWLHQSHEAAGK
jgi:hypothetical protein